MWTYLKFKPDGDLDGPQVLPPRESVCLVFDALRWRIMVGYRERGGYESVLSPNVGDDCHWMAWAPLNEPDELDMEEVAENLPEEMLVGGDGAYTKQDWPALTMSNGDTSHPLTIWRTEGPPDRNGLYQVWIIIQDDEPGHWGAHAWNGWTDENDDYHGTWLGMEDVPGIEVVAWAEIPSGPSGL